MKKFIYSLIFIGGFAFYAVYQNRLGQNPGAFADVSVTSPAAIVPTSTAPNSNISTQTPISNNPPDNPAGRSQSPSPTATAPTPTSQAAQPTPTLTAKPAPAPQPTPTLTAAPAPKGQYTDGQYTGTVADAYYGNVQVKVTVSGGKITDVIFLQYPSDRSTSRYINGQAMPYLKQEAIAAQSASVDIVSGATDTSQAFQQSLAAALAQAKT
ncbi:MAG: FMN-binding protein [Candidatus Doudnabacteria bacterium]|nr:FMN-binding protein [Candidatus Doudnabacteria bacterium]